MALDNVPAMVGYWDSDLRCRYANRVYEHWLGVKPEYLIGRHMSELPRILYELNRPHVEAALQGHPQEFERDIPSAAGGEPRSSLAYYIPHVESGVVHGVFVLVTDISVVKRTEAALRESEERFRLTLDEAPIGMAVVGTEGHFLRVNRALCDILGYTPQELVGMTFQAVTHPSDLDADLALAGQLARGEIPRYSLEKRYIRKDGRIVDVELSGAVLRDPQGNPLHFIAQVEDISKRKRVEREQQFFAALGPVLASALDARQICRGLAELATQWIADFCIVDVVDGGEMLRKIVASRDVGRRDVANALWQLPIDRSRPYLLAETIRTRRAVMLQRPDSATLAAITQSPEHLRIVEQLEMASLVGVPLMAGGRLLGAIALIASRGSREFDAADVRLAEELAGRVATVLENVRLYQVARDATRARDDILAFVAHDLRNPLSTIAMQADLLRRRQQPRAGNEAVAGETIQRAARRMRRLIEDLLDVSRLEAGRLSVEQVALDTTQFLREVVDSQRDLAASASVDLELKAPPQIPPIWADRHRLSQVFENLVSNALKFTGRGGRISLSTEMNDREVRFSVRDSGSGIQPEHLAHLFDRFWQAGRAQRHGAGLGLPIVKAIVEAHGGDIRVESAVGEGTCFDFGIPRADVPRDRPGT